MSSNIQHHTSHSRSSSIDDHQSTENDISIYATPKPDTPFVTPTSTPRLLHCRLNPVTTIRQHVPLKINFTQQTPASTSEQATVSRANEIKPMNTKKIRCVIQTNPSYQEGDGDQATESNPKQSSQNSGELRNNSIISHCHPEGDARPISNDDNQFADNFQSVAVIEKEIELMDRFVKDSIERLQKSCDNKTTSSDGCDIIPTANNCDNNRKAEKSKLDKIPKSSSTNKNICVHENNSPTRKCEKKKFYDPEDIRKYMMKKKSERQAKVKEERCKKETEAMALKKKSEATKMLVSKTRIPVLRSNHINEAEIPTDGKGKVSRRAKSLSHYPKIGDDFKIPKEAVPNDDNIERLRRFSKDSPRSKDDVEHPEIMFQTVNRNVQSCKKVAIPENLPSADSNHVINQCTENNRKISISNIPPYIENAPVNATFTKIKVPEDKMLSRAFPEELDVLKSKNPFNFLNILKGKANLVKNSININDKELSEDNLLNEAFPSSSLKKNDHSDFDRDQFLEDIIKRRIKIGNTSALTLKLNDLKTNEESENIEPAKKFSEISPLKYNHNFRAWPSEKNDKTYTILDKVDKSNVNVISDKNLSLDLSGIKSLSPIDKKSAKKLFRKDELLMNKINANDDKLLDGNKESGFNRTLTLESLQAHNVSLSLPDSFIKNDGKENCDLSMKNLSVDVRKLLEDESIFRSGIAKGADTSSVIGRTTDKVSGCSSQNFGLNESSILSSDDLTNLSNLSTTAVFLNIYDQMIKTEDEKLSQILKKIHQHKEALTKYLKTEVYALESKKNICREDKDEEGIKAIKKRQRALLLKITKNIQELEKMKTSVLETVERRKSEILRQKNAVKEKKEFLRQKYSSPKKKKTDKTFLISKQTNTLFMGISSSSSTSVLLDNEENEIQEHTEKEAENFTEMEVALNENCRVKDTATSPVNFNTGISIKLDLDPEKLLKLKNLGEIKIDPLQLEKNKEIAQLRPSLSHESTDADYPSLVNEREKNDKNSAKIKIKRPLSPIVLPTTKKVSQMRRLSSSSDVTFASFNDTTTDQSDVEHRISALQEQLRQRKLEAERLRREEKQLRKEKLRAKEQSLIKQLEAYDHYIQKVTKMLSEDRSLAELAKPQIKPVTRRPSLVEPTDKNAKSSNFQESFTLPNQDDNALEKNKIYDDMDGENTEDSEKHLRKADSGILLESEVTEISENVEIPKSKSESEINTDIKSENIAEKVDSEMKNESSSKSMQNFLQLISDIKSEVVSMSEQVYSSDFVEDITEDIQDSKSEISENATNNNTSLSIEEILSDHQYHSDTEPKPSLPEDSAHKNDFLTAEVSTKPTSKEEEKTKTEQSEPSDILNVKNISDIETVPSDSQNPPIALSEKASTEENIIQHPPSGEDIISVDKSSNEDQKIFTSFQNTAGDEISPVEAIETASSLQNISTEVTSAEKISSELADNSVFINFSEVEPSGNVESAFNEEFIKYESEGSCIDDVDEPVRKIDDIQTMMDGLQFSAQINDFSHSENFDTNDAEQNFDEILNNFESYFSVKITSINEESEILHSHGPNADVKHLEGAKVDQILPSKENVSAIKVIEAGLEETDVSESLEYDTTPTENSTNQEYNIHCTLSEKNKAHETSSHDDDVSRKIHSENIKSTTDIPKKYTDELSAEEDRSAEEFLEDYSIPNLGATTFIVNEDSESEIGVELDNKTLLSSPVKSLSKVHTDIVEQPEDFDQKINVDQTPFLEALRRERETLFGQKQDTFENVTSELFDKLMDENYARALDEITKNVDFNDDGKEQVNDILNETSILKTDTKVDKAVLKKHDKVSNDWLDKELNFNRERLREAEELRLQQMRIEQEIEELQAQQHIPPYLYLREIPNKPPPPYTPPSELNAVRIPQNEAELQSLINPAIYYVCKSLKKGVKIDDIKQLPEYTPNGKSNTEIATYKKFIFDLIKEVARNILENCKTKACLPWESLSKHKKPKILPKEDDLPALIENEILVLFGFRSKINKEKLIIQWSRKKRNDFVDDLLIKELQDEEAEWKNYEEDENIIKNQITQNLLDDLIQETASSLQDAFNARNKFLNE